MATTTNYGWTTPDDTSLVKDGASAIRSLGTAIDTSLNTALGTKKAGLVLLNTTTFSAVASQSVNNVFSATYKNYVIVTYHTTTADTNTTLRFRTSGTDNSNASYMQLAQRVISGVGTFAVTSTAGTASSILLATANGTSCSKHISVDIANPFATDYTMVTGTNVFSGASGAGAGGGGAIQGNFGATTSFDGFTLIVGTGTMTGAVSVYGRAE